MSAIFTGGDHFRRSLATDDQGRDEIDRDLIEVPWPEVNPPSRRKDSEIGNLLDLLANLPTGKESHEQA